jgi:hypothetical protein
MGWQLLSFVIFGIMGLLSLNSRVKCEVVVAVAVEAESGGASLLQKFENGGDAASHMSSSNGD